MKVFVINLDKDVARRDSIVRQCSGIALDFEIAKGVYGAAMSTDARARDYEDRKARWRLARSMSPAEIGCALSHINVYRRMEEERIEAALILEDDVVLPPELPSVLLDADRLLSRNRPEVWLLSPGRGKAGGGGRTLMGGKYQVQEYLAGHFASSYVLNLAAARSLRAELYPVGDVADCWGRLARYRVAHIFVVSPPVIEQDQATFGSSTTDDFNQSLGRGHSTSWLYRARRARTIAFELVYAPYRRWFRPYSGSRS
jgi:glycosyl transferase, family 25